MWIRPRSIYSFFEQQITHRPLSARKFDLKPNHAAIWPTQAVLNHIHQFCMRDLSPECAHRHSLKVAWIFWTDIADKMPRVTQLIINQRAIQCKPTIGGSRGGGGGVTRQAPPPGKLTFCFLYCFYEFENMVWRKKMCVGSPPPPPPAQRLFHGWAALRHPPVRPCLHISRQSN